MVHRDRAELEDFFIAVFRELRASRRRRIHRFITLTIAVALLEVGALLV